MQNIKIFLPIIIALYLIIENKSIALETSLDEEITRNQQEQVRVSVPKAIIYSDESLNVPLGFISQNKTITIGSPRKSNPNIAPLVIYGRLAYIEIKNVEYLNENSKKFLMQNRAVKEHNIDLIIEKPKESFAENNYTLIFINQSYFGNEIKELTYYTDENPTDRFLGLNGSFIHRVIEKPFLMGLNYQYEILKLTNFAMNTFMIGPSIGYTFYNKNQFSIDASLSFDISLNSSLKMTNFTDLNKPQLYGLQISSNLIYKLFNHYPFVLGISLKNYSVKNVDNFINDDGTTITGIKKMSGVSFQLGYIFNLSL